MIFVNFKTYQEGTGINALHLAQIIEEVSMQTGIKMYAVVQPTDIREITKSTKIEVWSQKIDPVEFGAHTGSILPEAILEDGAQGVFINHSEDKLASLDLIKQSVERATEVGLKTLVFATDTEELKNVLVFKPTFVSYEPADLVGSTTTSVSEARPEIIQQAAEISKASGTPLIVGAGIHSVNDVKKSVEFGAVGIAVATNIVKAQDPKQALLDLSQGFI
ncbi:triose-phosphate isomerase [Candidatus Microgenomates bacterium]|nr:triose-phosphate isomerase [Candidatus Microgenomates bacterium]